MVRLIEFDTVEEMLKYESAQKGKWLSVDEFNSYLQTIGHREIKTQAGRIAYCERNNVEFKKMGRAYFFKIKQ